RGWDAGSSVAVAGHWDLPGAEELDPLGADLPPGQMPTHEGAHVQLGVSLLQPADNPPEGEAVDIAEEVFDDAVLEVGAPSSQRRGKAAEQVGECSMGCPAGQRPHLVPDGSQRLPCRVGVDRGLPAMTSDPAALDAPPEEIEPGIYVRDRRLLDRQAQPYRCEHCGDFVPDAFAILAVARTGAAEFVRVADQLHLRAPAPWRLRC